IADWTPTFALTSAPSWWNHRCDPTQAQEVADALSIIPAICRQPAWAATDSPTCAWDSNLLHHGFDLGRLLGLSRRQTRIEWHAIAITQEMNFGAEATHGSSECMVVRFLGSIRSLVRRASSHT